MGTKNVRTRARRKTTVKKRKPRASVNELIKRERLKIKRLNDRKKLEAIRQEYYNLKNGLNEQQESE